eukprot:4539058-Pyramimonas_sp.AAC.1
MSDSRPQAFGLSQGCSLSPLLFSIVVTLLMFDATRSMLGRGIHHDGRLHLSELIYADDTLIVGVTEEYVCDLMGGIREAGTNYGTAPTP